MITCLIATARDQAKPGTLSRDEVVHTIAQVQVIQCSKSCNCRCNTPLNKGRQRGCPRAIALANKRHRPGKRKKQTAYVGPLLAGRGNVHNWCTGG